MKPHGAVWSAIILLFATVRSHAGILAGPITNPASGHEYYLLTPNTWTAAEAEAENLGGTLAVIKNAAEEEWVFSEFGAYGGITNRSLWIGLRRESPGGPFAWVTGGSLRYTDWSPGEPDNCGGSESYVHLWSHSSTSPGKWNDAGNNLNLDGSQPNGVVELPGKGTSLSDKEKSVIGPWYESGKRERPCYIAGTKNMLFQIYAGRAVRMYVTEESLYLLNGIRGAMVKDKILWSNGTWWSRKPVEYGKKEKSSDKGTDAKSDDAQKTAFNTLSGLKYPLLAGYIRHPANGGKAGCIAGMKSFGI